MDIYIKWDNDKNSIRLPILPKSFTIDDSMNNTSVNIHNLGDINLKGKRGLYGLSFDSFFPDDKLAFQHGKHRDPYDYYIKKLKTVFEDNTTVHVIITDTTINGFFTIENFSYGQNDRTMDVNYSLSFREDRTKKAESSKGRSSKAKKSESHKWKQGETWQKVTKSILGSTKTYKDQRKNNMKVVKKAMKENPNKKEKDALVGYKVVIKA